MSTSANTTVGLAEDNTAMDYSATMSSNPRDSESWNSEGEGFCLQKDSNLDMWGSPWNEVTLNEEDLSYTLDDETTPLKACGDLAYRTAHSGCMSKEPKDHRGSYPQTKRRRMLQFITLVEGEESIEEVLPEASKWTTGSGVSASGHDGLDSFEGWFVECLKEPEMNYSPNDMNFSRASDIQIESSEFCSSPPAYDATVVQQQVTKTPGNVVFEGVKSLIRTPSQLASSIVCPFAFIKPCEVCGDVTLDEINQRIHSPAPKSKQITEDASSYPPSAFSGKPVVGQTKIRTGGGQGSITIMRTKG